MVKRVKAKNERRVEYVEDVEAVIDEQALIRQHMENLPQEKMQEQLISFEKWYPILRRFGDPDDMSVDELLATATPLSVVKLVDLMMNAKSEFVQAGCAKDIAYMGGLKPVEKSASVNVNVMTRREATALLSSKLEKHGIEIIDGEVVNESDGTEEEIDKETGDSIKESDRGT